MKAEHNIQVSIVHYLRFMGVLCFAVPNGGQRNAVTGVKLKAEGVMAGVSDLVIILPNRVVFVEIKTGAGRQSDSQIYFQKQVEAMGFDTFFGLTFDK